tara:strand:+ start:49464 stop:50318 length:855 start_codon:yes stop_codon:yes gene_type:complete
MLDFIRFRVNDKASFESLIECEGLLDLKSPYNRITGEACDYPKKGKLYNLDVNISNDYAYIEGSIHKFYNLLKYGTKINHDDFKIEDCLFALNWVCEFFKLDKAETVITNLEFGFNLATSYAVSDVIKENILLWNYDIHNRRQKYKADGVIKEFGVKEYRMKIYAKGEESRIATSNLIRIELKITAKRILNRLNIYSLTDININAYSHLFREFVKQFDKLLIIDSINPPNGLELHDAVFFTEYTKFEKWNQNKKLKTYYDRKKDEGKLKRLLKQNNYGSISLSV